MEVIQQPLCPRKTTPIPIEVEAEWALGADLVMYGDEKISSDQDSNSGPFNILSKSLYTELNVLSVCPMLILKVDLYA